MCIYYLNILYMVVCCVSLYSFSNTFVIIIDSLDASFTMIALCVTFKLFLIEVANVTQTVLLL